MEARSLGLALARACVCARWARSAGRDGRWRGPARGRMDTGCAESKYRVIRWVLLGGEDEMAEITRKRRGELMRAAFGVLLDHPDGLQASQVLHQVESSLPLTEFEQSPYPNHPEVRRYDRIVRFCTIGPTKAGWLQKDKGIWTITDEGRRAFERYTAPEEFAREFDRLYRQWKRERDGSEEGLVEPEEVQVEAALEEAEERAWTEIRSHLERMNPYDFQELVAGLLRAMGYYVSWIAPPGKDGGIDVLAYTDPLGTKHPRIKIQVKRRADTKVTVDGLRSFLAVLGEEDVGLFVSMGGFSRDAQEEARSQERRKVTLLDLPKLFDLWVEHYHRVPEAQRRLLPLRPIYYLDLSE